MRVASASAAASILALAAPAVAAPGDIVAEVDSFQASFVVEAVAEGLDTPWSVAFLPDGRFLVSERPGRLRIVSADGTLSEPLEHGRSVAVGGQAGMFGVALDPSFADNGLIYFVYAAQGDGGVMYDEVARGRLVGDALSDVEVIWSADSRTPAPLHFGGRLVFDREGALFVTLGERFMNMRDAQSTEGHFGKVVRINPDGSIPADNPFANGGGSPDVWSYGHRNQQGAFLHPQTGELWTSEHGARGGDEINIVRAGANYGWPAITYGINYDGNPISDSQEQEGLVDPVWYWQPSIAPSGLTYYDGDAFPRWKGDVFAGGLAGMVVHRFEVNGERIVGMEPLLADFGERIRDVEAGPDGFIYILTDHPEGRLLRIRPKS